MFMLLLPGPLPTHDDRPEIRVGASRLGGREAPPYYVFIHFNTFPNFFTYKYLHHIQYESSMHTILIIYLCILLATLESYKVICILLVVCIL